MSNAPAAGDVEQPLPQLGGAGAGVGAAQVVVARHLPQLGAALGTVRRHDERALVAVARLDDRAEHLGDDVARLADDHAVADEDALALDLVRVVQRRQRDRRPGDEHRLHLRERGHAPGAADVDADVEELVVACSGGYL